MTIEWLRQAWPPVTLQVNGVQVETVQTHPVVDSQTPALLMLPGAQGTAEVFYKQLLAWDTQRRIVSITYPAMTDAALLADSVVAVADALCLERFDLLGTSLGGFVAQHVAVRHAPRVHRLVIGNSFCDPAPAQSPDKLAGLQTRPAAVVKAEALARVEASPESELRQVQLTLMGDRQSAEMLQSRMLAVQLASAIGPLGVPDDRVLLIESDNDPLIPPPMRAALRAAHPGAKSVVVEGGGHYPYITRPDAYNKAVAEFLSL